MKIQNKYKIRIGTRESPLAIYQAEQVRHELEALGHESTLVFIKSEGDINATLPVYEIGVEGVFTKALDTALLNKQADIVVHSLKDVPVTPAKGLKQIAVLKRGNPHDVLVYKSNLDFYQNKENQAVIATGSIRRKAQWLRRYPNHTIVGLRGNVNTRLEKLQQNDWNGAIFAAAGLERIGLRPPLSIELDWMIPAPAQGTIAVFCRANDSKMIDICTQINHFATEICTSIERQFLKALLGGCSNPIGALVTFQNNTLNFKGNILSQDGKEALILDKTFNAPDLEAKLETFTELGRICADEIKQNNRFSILIK